MKNSHGTYYCTVIIDTIKDRVVGASTLLMERKFIRGCAWVYYQNTVKQHLLTLVIFIQFFFSRELVWKTSSSVQIIEESN